jgi:hypothetical protein
MVETVGITKAIVNLNDIQDKFNLTQTNDAEFFPEWFKELPDITDAEKATLDRLKHRYLYYAADAAITEGTVNIIILSPLLELTGLCDPPFKIRGEQFVKIEIEGGGSEAEPILEGFIDALVVQNQFWIVLIESKRYGFSVIQALPQTLAYMMANPNSELPSFGMITTGEDYLFIKLDHQTHQYGLSDKFTIAKHNNREFYEVLQIIKRIINGTVQE